MAEKCSVAQSTMFFSWPYAYHVVVATALCLGLSLFILWYAAQRATGLRRRRLMRLAIGLEWLGSIIFVYGVMAAFGMIDFIVREFFH
ncbi:MAG: hypothetical protein QG604_745 [Candidatus Dependentiae bacterium]|nr:hypothetical protein [Candidatus Dependentiae bacterium]